jgi:hypothetical protein
MMQNRTLSADDQATLILFAAIIFGLCFRIVPAWIAGFPINDGGLFHTMILDLQTNHYIPPAHTTYNQLNIPFAYPPLGFYISAGISDLLNVSPLEVVRWLPGIINTLCIPSLYFLAKEISNNKLQSAISALVYALTPHMSAWLSMGGGLTRSFGILFMIISLIYVYRVFTHNHQKSIVGAILFGSLVVLSHTEAPVYTIAIAIYIWAMKSRSIEGIKNGLLIAFGVILLSGFWYGMVIHRHGLEPFVSAFQTGAHSTRSVLRLVNLDFMTEEPYLDLLGVLGLLGIAVLAAKKDYFIPGMLLVVFLSLPRSAHTVGNIPNALAAGFFVTEILLTAISKLQANSESQSSAGRPYLAVFLLVLIPYLCSNSAHYALLLSGKHVSETERSAMEWVQSNTDTNSKFIVISGEENPFCDATNEWFPSLTKRTSLTTLQGREWQLGERFGEFVGKAGELQSCIDEGIECMSPGLNYFGSDYNYIYVSTAASTKNCELANTSSKRERGLVTALQEAPGYSIAYRSEGVVIFEKE